MSYHVVYQFTDAIGRLDKMCVTGENEADATAKAKRLIKQLEGKKPIQLLGEERPD